MRRLLLSLLVATTSLIFISPVRAASSAEQDTSGVIGVPLCGMIPYFGTKLPKGFVWADGSLWPNIQCARDAGLVGKPMPNMVGNLVSGPADSNPTAAPTTLGARQQESLPGLLLTSAGGADDFWCGVRPAARFTEDYVFILSGYSKQGCSKTLVSPPANVSLPSGAKPFTISAAFDGVLAKKEPYVRANWIVRVK